VPNVYNARADIETAMTDVPKLVADIAKISDVECIDVQSLAGAEQWLRGGGVKSGDVLVCMGAGDVTELAAKLVG
jgi:UDP-N-acetylmuramate-alanine ligase